MAAKKPDREQVFEQIPDAHGRTVLDRPFSNAEAVAQDEEHRKQHEQNRGVLQAGGHRFVRDDRAQRP